MRAVEKKRPSGGHLTAEATDGDAGNAHQTRVHYITRASFVKHIPRPLSAVLAQSIATARRNGWTPIERALTALVERDRGRACNSRN